MVEGPTFGFGRDRGEETPGCWGSWCRRSRAPVRGCRRPTEDRPGKIVSSTRIRQALAEGDGRPEASRLLGHPVSDQGPRSPTAPGEGRGSAYPRRTSTSIDTLIPSRRRLRRPGDFLEGQSRPIPGRLQHRPQSHLRRADPQGRGPPDRLQGRPLRPDGRAGSPPARLRPTRRFAGLDDLLGDQIREVART